MNLLFWGLTVGIAGKILVVVAAMLTHNKIAQEHKIDKAVLRSFKTEKILTIIGLLLIVAGYFMELYFYGFAQMLTCNGSECAANLGSLLSP